MAGTSKILRVALGIPTLALFVYWALWEFLHLRISGSAPELIGYNAVKLVLCAFASYVSWRAWRWVSGKDMHFGKTPGAKGEPKQ
jgi:hypothetical protein